MPLASLASSLSSGFTKPLSEIWISIDSSLMMMVWNHQLSDLAPIERDDAALRHSAEWPRYARDVTAGNTLHRCSATAALRCDVVRCHNPHE